MIFLRLYRSKSKMRLFPPSQLLLRSSSRCMMSSAGGICSREVVSKEINADFTMSRATYRQVFEQQRSLLPEESLLSSNSDWLAHPNLQKARSPNRFDPAASMTKPTLGYMDPDGQMAPLQPKVTTMAQVMNISTLRNDQRLTRAQADTWTTPYRRVLLGSSERQ